MDKKLVLLLEDQINKEIYSAYLYLGMSDYYLNEGFDGFAHYFKEQAKEEFEHAEKFIEHMQDLDLDYSFKGIEGVSNHYEDLEKPLLVQVEHEKYVTKLINDLYELANALNEVPTKLFLETFILEQVEEEKRSRDLLKQFSFVKDDKSALLKMNSQLSKRD